MCLLCREDFGSLFSPPLTAYHQFLWPLLLSLHGSQKMRNEVAQATGNSFHQVIWDHLIVRDLGLTNKPLLKCTCMLVYCYIFQNLE